MDQEVISKAVKKVVSEMNLSLSSKANKLADKTGITLELAETLSKEVMNKAEELGMKIVVAVVNDGGNPVSVHCMDDSYIASYKIALDKAYTSVALKMATKELSKLANPNGGSLYGIQHNDPRIVIFGGGEPLVVDGKIIGAVAVSGGTAVQDTKLGEFARDKFKEIISWQLMKK